MLYWYNQISKKITLLSKCVWRIVATLLPKPIEKDYPRISMPTIHLKSHLTDKRICKDASFPSKRNSRICESLVNGGVGQVSHESNELCHIRCFLGQMNNGAYGEGHIKEYIGVNSSVISRIHCSGVVEW